jgi:hypothetical protein
MSETSRCGAIVMGVPCDAPAGHIGVHHIGGQLPPWWSVVCRDCPNIVHARDDGHVCVDPTRAWPPGARPFPEDT